MSAAPTFGEWQPIETAPKDDVVILTDGGDLWVGCWQEGIGWIAGYADGRVCFRIILEATHWMPMPPKPLAAATTP